MLKSKILKRASKIMEIHEECGYTPGHIRGYTEYEEGMRHMKHCIKLAFDEVTGKSRIECIETDPLVGLEEKS